MDDPWGSPWTSSADHNQNGGSNGGANGLNGLNGNGTGDGTPKPPQPALLAGGLSGNTPFASLPESSPWADDDDGNDDGGFGGFDDDNAFGDWTAAATTTNDTKGGASTPGSNGGWGAFAEADGGFGVDNGFGGSSNNNHLSPQRKDKSTSYGGLGGLGGLDQLSPIAWPSSAALSPAASPGGSPRRRRALSRRSSVNSVGSSRNGSRNGSLSGFARSPSVDPWSTVPTTTTTTTEKRDDTNLLPGTTRARASSTLSIPILRLDDSSADKGLVEEPQSIDKVATATATKTKKTTPQDVPQIVAEHVDSETSKSEEGSDEDDNEDEENDETPKPPPQPTFPSIAPAPSSSSRPSTSSSDGSSNHHTAEVDVDDPQQDSPTTSVEDDKAAHAVATTATTATTATPRPHVVQRKSSSKVQGLVELYDGLAARPAATRSLSASSSTRDSSRHGSIVSDRSVDTTESPEDENKASEATPKTVVVGSPTSESALATPRGVLKEDPEAEDGSDGSDGSDDGDEEEGEEDEKSLEGSSEAAQEETDAIAQVHTEGSKEIAADKPPQATEVDAKVRPAKEESHVTPPTSQTADTDILSSSRLLALFGKQSYKLDKTKVDELYNDKDIKVKPRVAKKKKKDDGEDAPVLDAFIPDYILDDSFTAISERKVWYRIARHGSYRKHAAGGDDNDNYRPVTWRTSAIRDDTVKIVRRWMEEDSFTGKPTLGGGFGRGLGGAGGGSNRSGNLFGWDSAAEPVALNEVFKRKKPAGAAAAGGSSGHKYNLSSASSAWANEGSGASAGSPAGFSPGFSPAPVFGWGTAQTQEHIPAKPESTRNSVQFERPMPSPVVAVPSPTTTQPSRFSVVLPPRDLAPTLPPSTAKEDAGAFADDGDDDDDWGEMISSPVKEEFMIPPLAAPLSLPPAPSPVQTVPAFAPPPKSHSPVPAPVPASVPAPTPQLDETTVASLANRIIAGLPDLSYMTV